MRRSFLSILLTSAVGTGAYACVDSSSTTTSFAEGGAGPGTGSGNSGTVAPGFDRQALLVQLGQGVIVPTYDRFVEEADALRTATAAYAASPSESTRDAARTAWTTAMLTWQRAELMQVGPAGVMGETVGGEDLRDEIYSWPLVNRCRVDQELVEANYVDANAFGNEPINVRGLDALEYLLFNESTGNSCPPQNIVNANNQWQPIVGELESRRAAYSATVAGDVHKHAVALRDRWTNAFLTELTTAGEGSATFGSAQEALNAISDAMFYIEQSTKDMKVATPAGLIDCPEATCPLDVESRYAGVSLPQIRQNVHAWRLLYEGGPNEGDVGFDDWLVAAGADDLASKLAADVDAIVEALDSIEEDDLASAVENDPASVEATYFAMKTLVDDLKSQYVTVLDLELPKAVQGDND